jgi:hypothetical protein
MASVVASIVRKIFRARAPPQIFNMVIGRIIIPMAALGAAWRRTDKRLKDQNMDTNGARAAA